MLVMYCYLGADKCGTQFFSPITLKSGLHITCGVTREHNAGRDPKLLPVFLLLDYQQIYVEPGASSKEQQL